MIISSPMNGSNDRLIGFYGAKQGQYKCFSNFYIKPFIVDSIVYICMEQYIMAQKALLFNDLRIYNIIMAATLPSIMKRYDRLVSNYDDTLWSEKRIEIINKGLMAKFTQNNDLKQILLSTNGIIAECSPHDRIWGIGYNKTNALANKATWGQNLLGKGLMQVRNTLRV